MKSFFVAYAQQWAWTRRGWPIGCCAHSHARNHDDRYFTVLPTDARGRYTRMFENMLDHPGLPLRPRDYFAVKTTARAHVVTPGPRCLLRALLRQLALSIDSFRASAPFRHAALSAVGTVNSERFDYRALPNSSTDRPVPSRDSIVFDSRGGRRSDYPVPRPANEALSALRRLARAERDVLRGRLAQYRTTTGPMCWRRVEDVDMSWKNGRRLRAESLKRPTQRGLRAYSASPSAQPAAAPMNS